MVLQLLSLEAMSSLPFLLENAEIPLTAEGQTAPPSRFVGSGTPKKRYTWETELVGNGITMKNK